ncbi:membrane protein insertase YidC [Kingella negevensis]|uniref:Membrane protein insertase YidC n=1 Tax=Kingella negevensis TaxID=1522312 RepID=A0A238TDU3_9NEIS|nr:membrane protein insertase YidC [Kingella negevensis]MDK4679509.1 membrane protein insertase YidC [Kingella negevensis]MDK4682773.1 membrane protein insertase YidC [Kingella negevensis]MDK4690970.1 membrane protein insertase YidC [Kingella negevensis]MDK4693883.1 membrane protein insertase YidC [Kingella negevensis]MDK4698294.1 membrane protein insertase YidC [Kingella negevensis]
MNLEFRRMLTAMVVSMLIMLGFEQLFPSKPQTAAQQPQQAAAATTQTPLGATTPISVETDLVKAIIDEKSGDLRSLTLNAYNATNDVTKPFTLFADGKPLTYIAQSELTDANGNNLLANAQFTSPQKAYTLNGDKLEVRLSAQATNGLQVDKVYTFTKNSYLVNVRFDVKNAGSQPVKLGTSYKIVRDNTSPEGEGWFTHSYNGPVVYTPDSDEFQKVEYKALDEDFQSGKSEADYQRKASGGYVGMIQHYFVSAWIMQPESVCSNGSCVVDIKRRADNLYTSGVNTAVADVPAGSSKTFAANLYAGPQVTSILKTVAPKFELTKDYGRVHIFASPLFALLNWLHGVIGNWGWAIIVLTLIVKAILFPLNQKAYKSMAKMRTVAPKMEALKKQYGEDRMGLQQAMMKLYKDEQINPLGGCLPMLVQMPIFIGLYWMIFLSVELRQAPWLGWITDLSRADPFYILPLLMAGTMYLQTKMSPPPSDPAQAQMMKIMPLMFSVMFFFFPAGLVLYYVVNNVLTMAQQWLINRQIDAAAAQPKVEVLDKAKK